MVKIRASYQGRAWTVLVLSTQKKRQLDIGAHELAAKEERSKKFKTRWLEDQAAKGNAYLWDLSDRQRLLAIDEEAAVRDLNCTRLSLIKTINKRFYAFSISRRDDHPEAVALLERAHTPLPHPPR
eukprot:m51a1_g11493 hypothetical protein (126) ;mRNA; f:22977-23582